MPGESSPSAQQKLGCEALFSSNFKDLFDSAEKAIKKTELSHGDFVVPAVNELRYAGYHIAKFLDNPDDTSEIDKAVSHCKRAKFDAYEASIICLIEEVKIFKVDYRNTVISDIISEYSTHLADANNIIDFIKEIDKETREEHYQECEDHQATLKRLVDILDGAREDLNKKIYKDRKTSFWTIGSFVVALAGIVIALLAYRQTCATVTEQPHTQSSISASINSPQSITPAQSVKTGF